MQDRLADLRQAVASKNPALADLLPPRASAVYEVRRNDRTDIGVFEAQLGKTQDAEANASDFMADYSKQINAIKEGIADIRSNGGKIRALKQQMLMTATPADEKELSDELQKFLRDTNKEVLKTKKALESLKHENDVFRSRHPNSSETRIRENMHSSLTRKFRELLTDYQTLQTEYKKSVKDKIERQVRIVCPEASEREIQGMVDEADSNIAQQTIYAKMTGAHESLAYAYQDIQDKHRDVKRLEQSVQELHQMFVDLAVLVEQQGELLDQIDFAVTNAADYTEKADKDLVVAQKNQSRRKKWGCLLSACLIILALIIIIPIIGYLNM